MAGDSRYYIYCFLSKGIHGLPEVGAKLQRGPGFSSAGKMRELLAKPNVALINLQSFQGSFSSVMHD